MMLNGRSLEQMDIPLDGEFSFSVDVPVTETPTEEQIEPQEETKLQPNVEEKEVDTVN